MLSILLSAIISLAVAIPTGNVPRSTNTSASAPGISFDGHSTSLPVLNLPYASYRAHSYHVNKDYYHFANIRFAAPPVGELRFAKPQPPLEESGVQDGSFGYACHQTETNTLMSWYFENDQKTSEDCLFLDVYVPGKVVRGEASGLPVLNWIYSGGYVFGSKDYLIYNTGMWLENTDNSVIYVSANHRMGAFGFLNGPTVEQEATPNVGLLDQRATLQWIRDYIHLVGGDNAAVTAWGLSSGAGSIMHHLVAQGGQSDPLFQRAIMNSPAFVPTYDNASMETSFQDFAGLLGCDGKGIACLRNVSEAALQNASAYTCVNAPKGRFGFGPAIDNEYILDLPGNELRKGNYWKNVSVLLSHVYREGYIFTDDAVKTDQDFQTYIQTNFPNMTESATQQFMKYYPATDQSTFDRLENVVSKWAVTCNTRWLAKAYQGSAWGYRFNVAPGFHGEDTLFNWYRTGLSLGGSFELDISFFSPSSTSVASIIQAQIASFARSGDPNTFRPSKSVNVPLTNVTETLNLLDITHSGVALIADEETPQDECDWWQTAAWTGVVR